MNLEEMIERFEGRQVEAALRYWDPGRHDWGVPGQGRRKGLRQLMTDRGRLVARVGELPSRLREFLVHMVKSVDWTTPCSPQDLDIEELPMESFELDAAVAALVERGFVAVARGRLNGAGADPRICIADEMGSLLEVVIGESRLPTEGALSLRLYLRFGDRTVNDRRLQDLGHENCVDLPNRKITGELTSNGASARRLDLLRNTGLVGLVDDLVNSGGILDNQGLQVLGVEADAGELRAWGQELEDSLLGCYHQPELVDHGISVRGGWLILFHEVVAELQAERLCVDPDDAEGDLQRSPDALADLRGVARFVERSGFKVKKNGEYYKTGVRQLARAALSPGFRYSGVDEDAVYALDFMVNRDLLATGSESTLGVSTRWRHWDKKSAVDRLRDWLDHSIGRRFDEVSIVHCRALRKAMLDVLKEAGVENWVAIDTTVSGVRNDYLGDAVRPEHAQHYQDRHKHAPFPPLASPHTMKRSLKAWILEGPCRFGLLEVAVKGGEKRPWAVRLTPLGGAVLGLKVDMEEENSGGCVVNPDHEIIVFPENAGFDFIQELARFAVRVKADYAIHFNLTRESVQMGAAAGLGPDEILETLQSNSLHEIPQNVVYSIRDWCRQVTPVATRRIWILETGDKKSMDRLLAIPELKNVEFTRISDTVVELAEDLSQSGIVPQLREHGFYL